MFWGFVASGGRMRASHVQAVAFPVEAWTPMRSRAWLFVHGFEPIKGARIEGHYRRYRLSDPRQYDRFYTKTLPNGVHLVIGVRAA